jgi:hypothetical protein
MTRPPNLLCLVGALVPAKAREAFSDRQLDKCASGKPFSLGCFPELPVKLRTEFQVHPDPIHFRAATFRF